MNKLTLVLLLKFTLPWYVLFIAIVLCGIYTYIFRNMYRVSWLCFIAEIRSYETRYKSIESLYKLAVNGSDFARKELLKLLLNDLSLPLFPKWGLLKSGNISDKIIDHYVKYLWGIKSNKEFRNHRRIFRHFPQKEFDMHTSSIEMMNLALIADASSSLMFIGENQRKIVEEKLKNVLRNKSYSGLNDEHSFYMAISTLDELHSIDDSEIKDLERTWGYIYKRLENPFKQRD